MRSDKMNGFTGELKSSFLSSEKDYEEIIKKLFVDSKPYSNELKRLLLITNPDCLRDRTNPEYIKLVNETSIADLKQKQYLLISPIVKNKENEPMKAFMVITIGNYSACNTNPYFRECQIMIDILCHFDCYELGDYQFRPVKIAGLVDGILDKCRLSGLGRLMFDHADDLIFPENQYGGFCLVYNTVHGADDTIPEEEE